MCACKRQTAGNQKCREYDIPPHDMLVDAFFAEIEKYDKDTRPFVDGEYLVCLASHMSEDQLEECLQPSGWTASQIAHEAIAEMRRRKDLAA